MQALKKLGDSFKELQALTSDRRAVCYTPVPGITTVSLHGASVHIDDEIIDMPGWCADPQHAMNVKMLWSTPSSVEAAMVKKVAMAIVKKMGANGNAVVLVPIWHMGGTGMAAILGALVSICASARIKVIYSVAGAASPASMRGGTCGGYNAIMTHYACQQASQAASFALVEAMHFEASTLWLILLTRVFSCELHPPRSC
jgi:hypothetical protein|eukprot:2764911-Prymnesium_polylepis.1